ncbi:ABC transporter ATP-binding protein [Streptomyces sp. NBC_00859]|uniref:ABC transporter ATP-binding protein n=1 Tax=Streptomyces sp. NBC_00859 TaxID=2903682 RepID=UPI00386BF7FC|nr:ATP-binding cassette domain-containing protein [Streptomyces sp. NBC_00859]
MSDIRIPPTGADPALLDVRGLTKRFGDFTAVDDVTFSVSAGGSLGIVGESGSGKTTTARLITGLDSPTSGTLTIDGRPRSAQRGKTQRLARARQVQIVFQDPLQSLDPRLSPRDTLDETLRLHFPGSRRDTRVRELLDQVQLSSRDADARPRGLSGGQRQRVAIARALAVRPRILVLDEAVAALDVSVQAQILNLLAGIREQTRVTYLFITHDLGVVRSITDDVIVMRHGRVIESGATATVLARPNTSYTRILLDSVPGPNWDPRGIAAAREQD